MYLEVKRVGALLNVKAFKAQSICKLNSHFVERMNDYVSSTQELLDIYFHVRDTKREVPARRKQKNWHEQVQFDPLLLPPPLTSCLTWQMESYWLHHSWTGDLIGEKGKDVPTSLHGKGPTFFKIHLPPSFLETEVQWIYCVFSPLGESSRG